MQRIKEREKQFLLSKGMKKNILSSVHREQEIAKSVTTLTVT